MLILTVLVCPHCHDCVARYSEGLPQPMPVPCPHCQQPVPFVAADELWADVRKAGKPVYPFLKTWFLERYEDPVDVCPFESAEGGYQFIWGGPYGVFEELYDTWGHLVPEDTLEEVADRLCQEYDCYEWSGVASDASDEVADASVREEEVGSAGDMGAV